LDRSVDSEWVRQATPSFASCDAAAAPAVAAELLLLLLLLLLKLKLTSFLLLLEVELLLLQSKPLCSLAAAAMASAAAATAAFSSAFRAFGFANPLPLLGGSLRMSLLSPLLFLGGCCFSRSLNASHIGLLLTLSLVSCLGGGSCRWQIRRDFLAGFSD
jgi:hypothetical protein